MKMTLRKFFLLLDQHLYLTGKKEEDLTIDQIF